MSHADENTLKIRARVLACLRPGYLTVIVGYGYGMLDGGIHNEIPMDIVPFDLRMPNSEFTVVIHRSSGQFIGVERREAKAEQN
jgi:hypothetical protein